MKLLKRIGIAILIVLVLLLATCMPTEPKGEVPTYMSDVVYIPSKVYAKGKPKRVKKKFLSAYKSLGKFTLTAYCGCSSCSGGWGSKTSTGTKAKAGRTIAVDPDVIPYGSKIKIGKHIYVAEDCGSAIKGKHIDIYFDNHSDAVKFGRQTKNVYKFKTTKVKGVLK
jgi:3D (Asp-Asp-Asp) domain-containing protein